MTISWLPLPTKYIPRSERMSYQLAKIIQKSKYPCYADEVEAMRQSRMTSRLEWRRRMRSIMAQNYVITLAWRAGFVAAVLVGIVAFSELLRLTVWTVLR